MKEKGVLLAVVLSIGVLLIWTWLFPPPPPTPQPVAPPPISTGETVPESSPAPRVADAAPVLPSEPVVAAGEETIRLVTDLMEVAVTNRGGRISSWRLKAYPMKDGNPLELLPEFADRTRAYPLALDLDDKELTAKVNEALYRIEREEIPAADGSGRGERIRFRWADESGVRVDKALTFRDGSYVVDLAAEVTDRGRRLPARIVVGPGFAARDGNGESQFHYQGQAVVNDAGLVARTAKTKPEGEIKRSASGVVWAGIEEQYFAAIVLPASRGGDLVIRPYEPPVPSSDPSGKKPEQELLVAVPLPPEGARLFVGPKKFTLLRSLGSQLEDVVWFSDFGLVTWLAKLLFGVLAWIHDAVAPNYGLAVILLTVALRVVLFPLNQYSMVSMRKMQMQMQRIQPKINAIRAKYKKKDAETRTKLNQETMALYQKEGINPVGGVSGCLPMFAQFPILIAFYDMLIATVELRGAPFFGWIQDLTLKDPYYVTPLLMGATMFIQQKMSTTKSADPQQAQQQKIMLMMPIVFTVMFLNLPSGLVLYWFVNNLLGIGQQWLVNRHIGRLEAATPQKA